MIVVQDELHYVCKIDLEPCAECACANRPAALVPRTVTCSTICNQLEDDSAANVEACMVRF